MIPVFIINIRTRDTVLEVIMIQHSPKTCIRILKNVEDGLRRNYPQQNPIPKQNAIHDKTKHTAFLMFITRVKETSQLGTKLNEKVPPRKEHLLKAVRHWFLVINLAPILYSSLVKQNNII